MRGARAWRARRRRDAGSPAGIPQPSRHSPERGGAYPSHTGHRIVIRPTLRPHSTRLPRGHHMHRAIPHRLSAIARSATALLAAIAAPSFASTSGVVISQVYGGNGNALASDYVELFNAGPARCRSPAGRSSTAAPPAPATSPATASPRSAARCSRASTTSCKLATTTGTALPTADATGTTNMSGTAGKVVLANVSTGLACNGASTPCSAAQLAQIVDFVGYGRRQLRRRQPGARADEHHRDPARRQRLHRHRQQRRPTSPSARRRRATRPRPPRPCAAARHRPAAAARAAGPAHRRDLPDPGQRRDQPVRRPGRHHHRRRDQGQQQRLLHAGPERRRQPRHVGRHLRVHQHPAQR